MVRILGRLIALLMFLFVVGGGLAAAVPGRTLADKCAWLERVREAGVYSVIGQTAKAGKASPVLKTGSVGLSGERVQVQTPAEEPDAKEKGSVPAELRVVGDDRKAREIEQAVFRAINETRAANGVAAVEWFEPVAEMARLRAREVLETGEFCHVSRKYGSCTDMYNRAGLKYSDGADISAGSDSLAPDIESLAKRLVNSWLTSPGHRPVLLGRKFKQVGVGAAYTDRPVEVTARDAGGTAFGFSFTVPQAVEVQALFITLASEGESGQ